MKKVMAKLGSGKLGTAMKQFSNKMEAQQRAKSIKKAEDYFKDTTKGTASKGLKKGLGLAKGTFPGQATPEAKQALLRSQPQVAPTPIRKPTAAEQKTYNDFLAAQKREAKFSKIKARPPGMAKGGMTKKK